MEQLSFSKINIGLAILNKRDDGYHNIDTIFQSIYLGDSIYFAKHHSVVFSGSAPELPQYMNDMMAYDETNLAMKLCGPCKPIRVALPAAPSTY